MPDAPDDGSAPCPGLAALTAWRAGDRAAGDALLRAHYDEVLAFFRLRVPHAAEDLTQRTFLACTEGRLRLRPETFRGFLFGIARRVLLRHFDEHRLEDLAQFRGPVPQSVLTPSGVVALRQEHWLLLRALEAVSLDHQVALALFHVQGLRTREVAEALEIPVSTVTSRLARAREALRDQVQTLRAPMEVRTSLIADLDAWVASLSTLAWSVPSAHR
jgi:RNA polymerase sigma factor (sigma-70 family)